MHCFYCQSYLNKSGRLLKLFPPLFFITSKVEGQPFFLRDYELVCLGKLPSQFLHQENVIQKNPYGASEMAQQFGALAVKPEHLAQSLDFHSGWQESTDF